MDYQQVQDAETSDSMVSVNDPLELLAADLLAFDTNVEAENCGLRACDCAAPAAFYSFALGGWLCVECRGVVRGES